MKVLLTEEAERDLEESVSYLLERNPRAAAELIAKVFDLAQRLADGMFDGPWEQLSDGRRVQSWPRRFPSLRVHRKATTWAFVARM